MAFVPLHDVLKQRAEEMPALKEAEALGCVREAWASVRLQVFTGDSVREHLEQGIHFRSLKKGELVIEAADAQTAALLFARREALRVGVCERCPTLFVSRVTIRRAAGPLPNRRRGSRKDRTRGR